VILLSGEVWVVMLKASGKGKPHTAWSPITPLPSPPPAPPPPPPGWWEADDTSLAQPHLHPDGLQLLQLVQKIKLQQVADAERDVAFHDQAWGLGVVWLWRGAGRGLGGRDAETPQCRQNLLMHT